MRSWQVAAIALSLPLITFGCGLFTSSQVATATAAAIEVAARKIQEQTGRNLDDLPTECEVESAPEKSEVYILCTVHTDAK